MLAAQSAKLTKPLFSPITTVTPPVKALQAAAATAILVVFLTGCATQETQNGASKKELRTTALQRWNRCIKDHLGQESTSDQDMSINESMEYCQGYRYDILATYPTHLSGSINSMLTDAAYRSGYRILIEDPVEPEVGELLPGKFSQHADRRVLDFFVRKAIR